MPLIRNRPQSNQKGYTLIEAIASMALITIAIVGSLVLTGKRADLTTDSFDQLSVVLARNELIGHLQRNYTWNFEINDPLDDSFECLRNVNSNQQTERDCTQTHPVRFNVYDNRAQLIFEGKNPGAGITVGGEFCTTFVPAGSGNNQSEGNPHCPIGVNLTWSPVCPTANCEDPIIEIKGEFSLNGGRRTLASDISKYDFVIRRTHLYCPAQNAPLSLVNLVGTVVGAASVVSAVPGANPSTGTATLSDTLVSCARSEVLFRDSQNSGSTVPIDDPNNRSRVCLASMDAPTVCLFEYVRRYDSVTGTQEFELLQNGAVVYTKPASLTFNSTTELRFRINRGLVRFCVDTHCVHSFENKTTGPARILFQPAATGFSPSGFTDILMRTL